MSCEWQSSGDSVQRIWCHLSVIVGLPTMLYVLPGIKAEFPLVQPRFWRIFMAAYFLRFSYFFLWHCPKWQRTGKAKGWKKWKKPFCIFKTHKIVASGNALRVVNRMLLVRIWYLSFCKFLAVTLVLNWLFSKLHILAEIKCTHNSAISPNRELSLPEWAVAVWFGRLYCDCSFILCYSCQHCVYSITGKTDVLHAYFFLNVKLAIMSTGSSGQPIFERSVALLPNSGSGFRQTSSIHWFL